MAITPRSFRLNPTLVVVAALSALGLWSAAHVNMHADRRMTAFDSCAPSSAAFSEWAPQEWGTLVHCLQDRGSGQDAYAAAALATEYHPTHSGLLNLRGIIAGRNGEHAVAVYDFRTGLRVTGSPDGVFENNIAWTTLYQLGEFSAPRQERILLEARRLYDVSLRKRWNCERAHTALFVEYAMADVVARTAGADDPRVAHAVRRYVNIYAAYDACLDRGASGDELVVEELLSAAAMDASMGRLAGVPNPSRHLGYARAAADRARALGLTTDAEWCERTVPVAAAVAECAQLAR